MKNIDRTLYNTKPVDTNRLEKEMASYALLEKLQIPFQRLDHDPAATIDDCDEIDSLLGIEICKNLFLCNGSKTEFYLLMMPGTKKFNTKDLRDKLGCSRLSFASQDDMEQYLNLSPGSVTILGLMFDHSHKVQLLMDREVAESDYIGCHPCINTSSLKIKTSDILEKFLPHTGHNPLIVSL